ncbi:MAG: hypothetical protein JEY79_11775 [Pseudodesulfovibrio sp.]|nr:hypothetical protein [Pseudodesulfovibrio sp.]
MASGRRATILRILKPFVAGLALAYFVTAFVDKPAPVHFQPENPYAARQADIVEPQAKMVMEKNIMKLGSPLSVQPNDVVEVDGAESVLETTEPDAIGTDSIAGDTVSDNATSSVKGEVEELVEP